MFLYFGVAVLQPMRKKLYSDLYFHPFFVNLTAETINLDDIMNGNGKSVAMMSLFRRGFMLVALLAVGVSVFGQTLTQQGVTCRYNGAKPHTPLGNVYIKVGSAGNAVKSDSLTGKFALTLSGLRMGMRIGRPVVVKKGMMVFNQQAVDEWSVRMEPLCVVLCDADFFQRQKNTLIEHGKRIARQKCDRRINWLEQQLKDNRLREEEYIVKLDSVQRELEMAQQQMDGCADVLARIDSAKSIPCRNEPLICSTKATSMQPCDSLKAATTGANSPTQYAWSATQRHCARRRTLWFSLPVATKNATLRVCVRSWLHTR